KQDAQISADAHRSFELGKRFVVRALAEVWHSDTQTGIHEGDRVRRCLSDPQALCTVGESLSELSQLSKAPGQRMSGVHRREDVMAKAFVALRTIEGGHGPSAAVDGLSIGALVEVGHTEVVTPAHLEAEMPTRRGEGEHALADSDGPLVLSHPKSIGAQKEGDLPQPMGVVEALCEPFGLAQDLSDPPEFTERRECIAQGEPEIDGLSVCGALLWERVERL